jgi:hypothetical protein
MLEDKIFLDKEVTPSVTKIVDTARYMLEHRVTLPKIYEYILTHSNDYQERYMSLFLFGVVFQNYKEDYHLR